VSRAPGERNLPVSERLLSAEIASAIFAGSAIGGNHSSVVGEENLVLKVGEAMPLMSDIRGNGREERELGVSS
jgi:hypothetical protein